MTDNVKFNEALPQAKESLTETNTATTPETDNEIFIPVKFNKEIINLDVKQAATLAGKGIKFDLIAKDYESIKNLAANEGKSVGEFINLIKERQASRKKDELLKKCGGDQGLADYILNLEQGKREDVNGFLELKEAFPEIKDIDSLPSSVLENAKLKGTLLLDEYLRYRLNQKNAIKQTALKKQQNFNSSIGSQINKMGNQNPETAEFLRGLWQK